MRALQEDGCKQGTSSNRDGASHADLLHRAEKDFGPCRYTALTSSEDGTVRVWDTHNVVQKTVVKPTLAKPGRVTVSMARYNNDGHLIVAGLNNGTLQSWDVRGTAPDACLHRIMHGQRDVLECAGEDHVRGICGAVRAGMCAEEC